MDDKKFNFPILKILGIISLLFSTTYSLCQPLIGEYTIGGDVPDFGSITEAIDDLSAYGVSGDVTFNIRNGTYEEKLVLPEVIGASEFSRIVFQSEFGHWDSVKVTFDLFADYSENYVWFFDGADFITLKDLSIINVDADFSTTLRLSGNANNNQFIGVKFDGRDGDSFFSHALIGILAPCDYSNTLFEDCYFREGSANIYGSGDIAANNFVISECTFNLGKSAGINLVNISNPTILNNTFRCAPSCHIAGQKAITLSEISGIVKISYNNIDLFKGAGLIINGIDEGIDSLLAVNNYIGSSLVYAGDAVQFRNVNAGIFAQNSINVIYNAAYFESCYNLDVFNNIFVSSSNKAISFADCLGLNSNNNCFYGQLYSDGFIAEDLTEFQIFTGTDDLSIYHNPLFIGTPYAYTTDDYFLHNTGAALAYPTDDIHEFTRDVSPDIGALEFNLPDLEANLFGIGQSTSQTCSGWYPIKAEIINMGIEDITLLSFEVYYNDELYSSSEWTGLVLTGDTLITEVLDSILLVAGSEQSISLNVSAVNGGGDAHIVNNSFGYANLKVALSGDYTVGNVLSNYENFGDAMNDLNDFGTCGNVRFLLNNGEYDGGIYLNDFYQSDPLDTVSIEGLNTDDAIVTISSSSFYVFRLNGLDNFIFKNVTLKSTGASSVIITENTNMLGLSACHLIGVTAEPFYYDDDNSTAKARAIIKATNTAIIDINNCNIINGSSGLSFEDGVKAVISESDFTNFSVSGINAYMFDSLSVLNNKFKGDYVDAFDLVPLNGIRIDSALMDVMIRDNEIAIHEGHAFSLNNSPAAAIKLWNNAASSTTNSVVIDGCSNVELIHNSFHLYPFGILSAGDMFNLTDASGLDVKNNLFKHSSGGDFLNVFPLSSEFDYNGIFLSAGLFSPSHIDFVTWQGDGNGLNSYNIDPSYLSDSLLHIASAPAYTGTGIPFPSIHTDLERKYRYFPPDIGAYNIGQDTTDIELLAIVSPYGCDSLLGLVIDVSNNGPDTLLEFNIYFTVNEVLDSVKYSEVILPDETVNNFLVQDLVFEGTEDYDIEVWCETKPWNLDLDLDNNSAETSISGLYMKGVYNVGGIDPDFHTLYDAVERLKISGMCDDVVLNVRKGVYEESIDFENIAGLGDTIDLLIQGVEVIPDSVMITGFISFINIENISITKLHFKKYARNIEFLDTCKNINLLNNKFHTWGSGYANIDFSGIETDYYENFNITGNDFQGSKCIKFGLFHTVKNIKLLNNRFFDSPHLLKLVEIRNCENLIIEGNENVNITYPEFDMFYFKFISGDINISSNNFYVLSAEFYSMEGSEENPAMILNNIWGSCEFTYSDYIEFLHNTVSSCPPEAPCLNTPFTIGVANSFINVNNNIFNLVMLGGGRQLISILEYYHDSPDIQCDHNLYYAEAQWPYFEDRSLEALFESVGDYSYTLLDWQENTPYDTFSTWGDPQFISRENARLSQDNIFPFLSDISLDSVTHDIDDELRSEITPLYGADEYIPHNSNSSVYTILVPHQCGTNKEISVYLVNTGTENLTSSTINWKINDSLVSPFLWTGDLDPEDTAVVYLGDYDLGVQNIGFITSWSEMPNGIEDPFAVFDTAHFILKKKYAGHYTVDGEEPDFPNLQTAIDSFAFYGICDSVFLNVRSGLYEANINIPYINGVSDSSWVTIQSEVMDSSMVTFEAENYRYTFILDSAQYIQIRNLSIIRTDYIMTTGCVQIINKTSNINLNNISFIKSGGSDAQHGMIQVGENFDLDIENELTNLKIENNRFFTKKSINILFHGDHEWDDDYAFTIRNILISGNTFISPYSAVSGSVECIDFTFVHNLEISNNKFFRDKGRAIVGGRFSDTLRIINNTIHSNYDWHSIHLQTLDFPLKYHYLEIINNEISEHGNLGRAITIFDMEGGLIANNSIFSAESTTEDIIQLSYCDLTVINNQFINQGDGMCYGTTGSLIDFEHNNYYSSGNIGVYNGEVIPDIVYSISELGLDSNSIFGDPEFLNDTTLLSTNLIIVDQGENLDEITDDIIGNPRVALNDIGAYEIDDYELNLTILAIRAVPIDCGDSLDIFIDFKNSGLEDINNFDISVEGDGVLPGTYEWLGTLEHFDVVNDYFVVTLAVMDLPTDITIVLFDPNDDLDEYPFDNSLIEATVAFTAVNTDISYEAVTLTALTADAEYQWVNCDAEYAHIEDEVNQEFTPLVNGNYAVIIDEFGCIDTSECYSVSDVGIQTDEFSSLRIYPNPTTGEIWLDFGSLQSDINITLYSSDAKLIYTSTNQFTEKITLDLNVAPGVYFIKVNNQKGENRIFKILKQ